MFTGIIQAQGKLAAVQNQAEDARFYLNTGKLDLLDVQLGDSIAVNGVCLTAVELPGDGFWADVSAETLRRTCLGKLKNGSVVNLEKALTPSSRLGGHLVSGHVDGIGEVTARRHQGRSELFTLRAPDQLARYIAEKGSICLDGVSLTVNGVSGAEFELNIVPHTLEQTIISGYRVGTQVNLEVDIIARYLERLLLGDKAAQTGTGGIDYQKLQEYGFIK